MTNATRSEIGSRVVISDLLFWLETNSPWSAENVPCTVSFDGYILVWNGLVLRLTEQFAITSGRIPKTFSSSSLVSPNYGCSHKFREG